MNTLKLSDNLVRLRKEKKITQEELADFIGVTKASVSKWENRQSMPDILLLPQLASFFGVTVDELLGYEPQLSREQIQRIYINYTSAFASRPFPEVIQDVRAVVKKYYSCYPLLLQICILYLNHCSMAEDVQDSRAILLEASGICEHIIKDCGDVGVCSDAISLKAVFDLQLGNAQAVIEALESVSDPARLSGQNDALLIQAYQLAGQTEQAVDYTQITIYLHLLSLVSASVQYLALGGRGRKNSEDTICRIESLAGTYLLDELHPNVMAQFYYQAALTFMACGEHKKALEKLGAYERTICFLMSGDNISLHGDAYFDRIDIWIENLALGANPPRDKVLAARSALQALEHPAFEAVRNTAEYKRIRANLSKGVK